MATRGNAITGFNSGDPLPLAHGLDELPAPVVSATLTIRRFPTDTAVVITKTVTTTHADGTGTLAQAGLPQQDGTFTAEAIFELTGGANGDTAKLSPGVTYWYEVQGTDAGGVARTTEIYCTITPRQVGPSSF